MLWVLEIRFSIWKPPKLKPASVLECGQSDGCEENTIASSPDEDEDSGLGRRPLEIEISFVSCQQSKRSIQ